MKVAVVGGGIFGCTAAIYLARDGHSVTLYEQDSGLLYRASRVNQYRLHAGYHYPRSTETAIQSKAGLRSFTKEYQSAIITGDDHYYLIPNEGSKVTVQEYRDFMDSVSLEYEQMASVPWAANDQISGVFKVNENSIDISELRRLVYEKLIKSGVKIVTNTKYEDQQTEVIVNAAYSNLNFVLTVDQRIDYQFEVCAKPIVRLPHSLGRLSAVIIDGNFGCVDPYGRTYYHVLGHVEHAVIHRSFGHFPSRVDYEMYPLNKMITHLSDYIPDMTKCAYKRTMYTVRTVLPNRDYDDARPTYVTKHNDRMYSVFSGKIGTAVDASIELCQMLGQ